MNIVKDSGYAANEPLINEQPEGHKGLEIGHPSTLGFESCAIVGDGSCALRQGFPEDVEFGLVIRFAKVVNGLLSAATADFCKPEPRSRPMIVITVNSRRDRFIIYELCFLLKPGGHLAFAPDTRLEVEPFTQVIVLAPLLAFF